VYTTVEAAMLVPISVLSMLLILSCIFHIYGSYLLVTEEGPPTPFRDVPVGSTPVWHHLRAALAKANFTFDQGRLNNTGGPCLLPLLDPWDPDILDFVSYMPSTECASQQPSLLYTRGDRLVFNTSKLASLGLTWAELRCVYSYVFLKSPDVTDILPSRELHGVGVQLSADHNSVAVKCDGKNGTRIYENVLMYVPALKATPGKKKAGAGRYSVTMLLIESMSQMNVLRSLPSTLATVEALGGALLQGHHKVAENTECNVHAIQYGEMINRYQEHGWLTLLMEDAAVWGTSLKFPVSPDITYLAHYKTLSQSGTRLRSNNLARWLEHDKEFTKSVVYKCQQEQLLYKYQFDMIRDFHFAYKDQLTFSWTHHGEGTHDDLNFHKYYDKDLNKMIQELSASGALNDTFFVVFGDHGFGGYRFRAHRQGHIESTMPGLMILPPLSFAQRHPEMAAQLKSNSGKLTSQWDLNRTLRHILSLSLGMEESAIFSNHFADARGHCNRSPMERGTSLFLPVGDRTCSEVHVPLEYCSCEGGARRLPPRAMAGLASAALRDMDAFLRPLWGCRPLALVKVLEAQARAEGGTMMLEARVTVVPRNATFFIRIFPGPGQQANVTAVLTRLDRFEPTSRCVPAGEVSLRPFCICPE
jgi:hypothetical protein